MLRSGRVENVGCSLSIVNSSFSLICATEKSSTTKTGVIILCKANPKMQVTNSPYTNHLRLDENKWYESLFKYHFKNEA